MSNFASAGQKEGIEVWRIENFEAEGVDPKFHGKFYTGDSYILLKTTLDKSGNKSFALHYWLGDQSSQDETGTAAYKSVELSDNLPSHAVHHREVQGHESALFLSYFHGFIEYMDGGVSSGFKHIERDSYEPRLLHIKGKRTVRVFQVAMEGSSLNDGDVFILDLGMQLFFWAGPGANRYEKAKGLQVVINIKNTERGGKPDFINVNDGAADGEEFWTHLGVTASSVKSADEGGDDEEENGSSEVKLFHISDASGDLVINELTGRPLERDMLQTDDVFLLDSPNAIYVWIGKGATDNEKKTGMQTGEKYLKQSGRPEWTQVVRVVEGAEDTIFKSFFRTWDRPRAVNYNSTASTGIAKKQEQKEIDYGALHTQEQEDAFKSVAGGHSTVYRIANHDIQRVDGLEETNFFSHECYIVDYAYSVGAEPQHLLYFWLGAEASTDKKGTCAFKIVDLDKETTEKCNHVRMVMNKEPSHFLALFETGLIIHNGEYSEGALSDTSDAKMYHIRGTNGHNTHTIEVEPKAASLNSGDCFALLTPEHVFLWQGRGSNEEEKTIGTAVADLLSNGRAVEVVAETEESDSFWEFLGGKGEYSEVKEADLAALDARLFHVSNATGTIKVEEIVNFAQEDLIDDDVMILDTFTEVFIWIGSQSNEQEKTSALEVARKYNETATDGRDADTAIIRIKAGGEPPLFTRHFHAWDAQYASKNIFEDPYQKKLNDLKKEEDSFKGQQDELDKYVVTSSTPKEEAKAEFVSDGSGFYPLEVLQTSCPDNVDPTRKQESLSDEEFKVVFKMTKDEFVAVKDWKKVQLKKQAKLF